MAANRPPANTLRATHPALEAIARWAASRLPDVPLATTLDASGVTDLDVLNAAAARVCPVSHDGMPLRFVAAGAMRTPALAYERRIREDGEIATRMHDRHDACNALAWLMFPRTKAALNATHTAAGDANAGRSRRRDAATLLDEFGVIMLCAAPRLLTLWREHRWSTLFDTCAPEFDAAMRIVTLGHGLMAALARPFPALTAKALVVCPVAMPRPGEDVVAACDAHAARWLTAQGEKFEPASLLPLPIAAWPHWDPFERGVERFQDTRVFRPVRAPSDTSATKQGERGGESTMNHAGRGMLTCAARWYRDAG